MKAFSISSRIIGVVVVTATAATPQGLDTPASLEDLQLYAALNNPAMAAAFQRWQAATQQAPQVGSLPDPELEYSYYLQSEDVQDQLELMQMVPWFGKRELRARQADEEAEAARARFEQLRWELRMDVAEAYADLYYLERALEVVADNQNLLRYFGEVAQTLMEVNLIGYNDVVRVHVEQGRLENERLELESMRAPLMSRMNALLNRPGDEPLQLKPRAAGGTLAASDEELLAWLRAYSPMLREREAETRAAEHGKALAQKEYYPDFRFGVEVMDMEMSGMDSDIRVIAGMTLPLYRRKIDAGVRQADAVLAAARLERENAENQLWAEARMALFQTRDAERRIRLYRDTLLPKAEEALTVVDAAFRTGTVSFLELIDAEKTLLEFGLAYHRACADQIKAIAALEQALGSTVPVEPDSVGGFDADVAARVRRAAEEREAAWDALPAPADDIPPATAESMPPPDTPEEEATP